MPMGRPATPKLRFGQFEIDSERRILNCGADHVSISPKAFDLLVYLVNNSGSVVSKDEIFANVWPDQFVEENNLTVHISSLRKAFGDRKGENNYIVTIPAQGYKFIAEVIGGPARRDGDTSQSLAAYPSANLIQDSDPLIGRDTEIAEVKQLIKDGTRLVTLTGAGGTGKTRLAMEIASELRPHFPQGVFFVELAAASGGELVISAVAKALGVKESVDRQLTDAIKEFLQDSEALLVLDNFEHLLSSAPFVKDLLSDAPSLTVLITSRAALHLNIEKEFFVSPLELPPAKDISADQLMGCASAALFCRRAQVVKPSFSLTSENAVAVAAICSRLDGLPLAIELAAARIKLLSPQAILERIAQPLTLLTGGRADQPVRQRTMRDTIKWSRDLLSERERDLFHRLSVFAGGFSIEAAEAIEKMCRSGSRDDDGTEVLDLLTSLVDNNLLVSADQADGQVRLRMLEVVREFALESLDESGNTEAVRQHHSQFFTKLVSEADPQLSGRDPAAWLDRLEAEHDDLRATLRWLTEREPMKAGQVAASLTLFWIYRGYLSEARRWLDSALEMNVDAPTDIRLRLLNSLALVARHQGDHAAARRAAEESLKLTRSANDLPQIILSCHAVAGLETREGNFAAARELIEEALSISRRLGDEKQIAFTLSFLGNLLLAERKAAQARPPIEESLAISQRLDLRGNVIINLTNLGTAGYYEGDIGCASRNFHRSLILAREMGNKILVSCCIEGFGAVAVMLGEAEQAAYLAGAAEGLRQLIGYEVEITEQRFREDYMSKLSAQLDAGTMTALIGQGMAADPAQLVEQLLEQFRTNGQKADTETLEIIIKKRKVSHTVIEDHFGPEDE